jgi:hypothetical protein
MNGAIKRLRPTTLVDLGDDPGGHVPGYAEAEPVARTGYDHHGLGRQPIDREGGEDSQLVNFLDQTGFRDAQPVALMP